MDEQDYSLVNILRQHARELIIQEGLLREGIGDFTAGVKSAEILKDANIEKRIKDSIVHAKNDWLVDRTLRILGIHYINKKKDIPDPLAQFLSQALINKPPKKIQGENAVDRNLLDNFIYFLVESVIQYSKNFPDEKGNYAPLSFESKKPRISMSRNIASESQNSFFDIVSKEIGKSYSYVEKAYYRGKKKRDKS